MLWTHVLPSCLLLPGTLAGLVQYPLQSAQSVLESNLDSDLDLPKFSPWLLERADKAWPIARPCYEQPAGSKDYSACWTARMNKKNDIWTTNQPGGYFYANWGSCQATHEMCAMPLNNTLIPPSKSCLQGSIPNYVFKPETVEDVQAIFKLAHHGDWNVPLVIKNTGHDWMGRSAGVGSLALWTHHWRHPERPIQLQKGFVPQGCDKFQEGETVFHFSAGEQWGNLYQFAEENNLAVLGGTCGTVGVAGWLSGGGHSPLTPWYGMGVDNVRQVEIVTPKGDVLVANECINQDLFFAVRGGGGGTFGLVTRITYKALEKFEVIGLSAKFKFSDTPNGTKNDTIAKYFEMLTSNARGWASKGWGGYIKSTADGQDIEIINANSSLSEANKDLSGLIELLTNNGIKCFTLQAYESWYEYVDKNLRPAEAHPGGSSGAVASRLMPPSVFDDVVQRADLSKRLTHTWHLDVNMWLMLVTPTKFLHTNTSALHPSWKDAIWSVRLNSKWDQYFASDADEVRRHFVKAHTAMDTIREIAPGTGVSINEADIWEDQRSKVYWGEENYKRLKRIKDDVDPQNILTNWAAVGWNEQHQRYRCYPKK